jgi:hypothetical protein
MPRIFMPNENPYNAADSVRQHGYAAVEGTKSSAVPYCERVIVVLGVYEAVKPSMSYVNVPKLGYLYFVYDAAKLKHEQAELLIQAYGQ